ncbi:MAG: polysaccharide biosynthesis/export family protein [Terracidiphilus sp.]|jgi:polysaccharide export outer membrane protein
MKPAKFLISILFVSSLICHAQDQAAAGKPAQGSAPAPAAPVQAGAAPASTTSATAAPATATPTTPAPDTAVPASTTAAPPVPPAAPPASTTPAGAVPADTYVIGDSDEITVTVWREPTLSGSLLVRPDGMISMALLGDVHADGLTPLQLADQIETKLKKFLQDPKVSVVMTGIHSKVIYLLGEVGHKGQLPMTPGMTLLEAIADAGGLTDNANAKKIYILRNEGGTHQKIPVHYKEALKGDVTLNLAMKPGDTIVVP